MPEEECVKPEVIEEILKSVASGERSVEDAMMQLRHWPTEDIGFARVDLAGHGDDQRLVVSLFGMPRYPIVFWAQPELLSRWSIRRDGTLLREPLR
jgi:hypothetical protein